MILFLATIDHKPLRMNAVHFQQQFSVFVSYAKMFLEGVFLFVWTCYTYFSWLWKYAAGIIHVGRYFLILSLLGWHYIETYEDLILFALGLLA
jgi:hypothetical protein